MSFIELLLQTEDQNKFRDQIKKENKNATKNILFNFTNFNNSAVESKNFPVNRLVRNSTGTNS